MPREHDRIRFSEAELAEFLGSDQLAIVATVDADGEPWCDAAAYLFDADRIVVKVPVGSRTHRNINADPRVCCVVESLPEGGSYYDIKGAMIHGVATAEDPVSAASGTLARLRDPVEPELAGDFALYAIGLDDVVSFAFDKIAYRYDDRSTPPAAAPIGD
ncbi:MAG TPA: pyridoxamine 5'-phosphate oxidase family protein [Ilumatobacter sp.]|nr:pyridoxamine 5'-phosphate oxidase family protein [Ilumatobacter sp.]